MVLPPAPVFDNLNYVGHGQYGAWVLETSAGLILIDALNSPEEGREYIEAGMAGGGRTARSGCPRLDAARGG